MAHMIIGGKACQAVSGETLEVRSPVDGQVFEHIPVARQLTSTWPCAPRVLHSPATGANSTPASAAV